MDKLNVKKLPKSKIEFSVKVPKEEIEKCKEKAAKEYSNKHSIKGYRPGKAPVNKVEELMGSEKLMQEALEIAVRESYAKTVIDNKISAIGTPEIKFDNFDPKKELKYKAVVAVFPEVEICDIKKLKIKKPDLNKIKVEDEEVNELIDKMLQSKAKLVTVNRASKKGDRVEIDFKLLRDNVPYEGGTSKNHPLIIGGKGNHFIPGFEEELIGLKAGDKKTFELKFPDKYHDKKLEGKKGAFKVKMNLVQEQEMPKLDDDFAKNIGKYKNKDEMLKRVKENIKQEKEAKVINEALEKLIDKIIEESRIEIPEIMVEDEKNKMLKELEMNVASMGLGLDQYLNQIKKTKEELMKDWDIEAYKRISAVLVFREIFNKYDLKIEDSEIKQKSDIIRLQHPNLTQGANEDQLKEYARSLIVNEKSINWLKNEILGVEKK